MIQALQNLDGFLGSPGILDLHGALEQQFFLRCHVLKPLFQPVVFRFAHLQPI